ncbi:MAG: sigma-70 family RNA polymerase sigma factor [Myxococcota bacterium]
MSSAPHFVAALPEDVRDQFDVEEVSAALRKLYHQGLERYPDIEVDEEDFAAFVAARAKVDVPVGSLHGAGLFLACACLAGDNRAVARFQAEVKPVIDSVFRRLGFMRYAEEIRQRVLRAVVVGESGHPALVNYTGRGAIGNWIRVITVREAYRYVRQKQRTNEREVMSDDDRMMDLAVAEDANPELLHLKQDYRDKFKQSFQTAFANLTHRQRNVLRYQYLDGLNLEQIGAIYDVSRATVARWRAQARDDLFSGTRKAMRDIHRVPADEFKKALQLIESAMDVSLSRLLLDVAALDNPDEGAK